MSIIPGIDSRAPERTDTSSGSVGVAEAPAGALLRRASAGGDLLGEPVGEPAAGVHVGRRRPRS